ncbi:MAG TPA: ribbon-helix-helix protein, CopG family [Candidatus Diapherotrites archaeon]|uniref:Ribbon-helix-helix protein, CopG family n=1 Tax=Candidatus Iainarchaeum sp. TaxID=3101447 RepID=A0A7J4IZ10_9ARCH|nr:ribbon-helix-helix protein, CopG family [Candidatus Diapherotrites archaeon]
MDVIPAKVTPKLVQEIDSLVEDGWYASRSEVIRDAVRELVKKMKAEKLEAAIKEDVEWGLK